VERAAEEAKAKAAKENPDNRDESAVLDAAEARTKA
jgi:hypothetical protein